MQMLLKGHCQILATEENNPLATKNNNAMKKK